MNISRLLIRSLCLLSLWLGLGLQVHAQTDKVTYVYTDPQGTPLVEADASGNIVARYDYTPYGSSVASLGNPPNGPGYTGHVNDPETGLVYMQARYYQPIGRFLSPDPVGPAPGNLFSFNRYDYANNNPVVNMDPDGRCPVCIAVAAVAGEMAVGAVIGGVTDYGVQKIFNHGKPVNMNEVEVSAGLGALSAGSGGAAVALVRSGALSIGKAVAANAAISAVAGGAGRIVQGKMDKSPATTEQIAASAVGNGFGSLLGSVPSVFFKDFSQASSQGFANNISKATVDSPAGIGYTIANDTRAIGIGEPQTATQSLLSQAGQASANMMTSSAQEKIQEDSDKDRGSQ